MLQVPRVESYRGFIFVSQAAGGPEPGGLPRPHDDLDRRHGRPRAGRRDRGRRRRIPARLQRQLEALSGKSLRRRASVVHAPLFDRRPRSSRATKSIRRHRRDRDPPDAPERSALLFWEIPGRYLDLSERPQLSRRLSRRRKAGRRDEGSGCSANISASWRRRRARRRPSAFSKCGAGTPISIRTCRS